MKRGHLMNLSELTGYLDQYLQLSDFSDAALNGLQVENSGKVSKIALAVDAGLEAITAAAGEECNLLIVHHGLFWGKALALRSFMYKRIKALILADMALYAVHLPLDAHPDVGHNSQIAGALMLKDRLPFGMYAGSAIGVQGNLKKVLSLNEAVSLCEEKIGDAKRLLLYGPKEISRIGIISGSASEPEILEEAAEKVVKTLS